MTLGMSLDRNRRNVRSVRVSESIGLAPVAIIKVGFTYEITRLAEQWEFIASVRYLDPEMAA